MMKVRAIRVRTVIKFNDDLFSVLGFLPKLSEKSIVVVSSKIVSLCEGRAVLKSKTRSRDELVMKEAERYVPRRLIPGHRAILTIKDSVLSAAAGVDEFDGYFVLWPKFPVRTAEKIQKHLRRKWNITNLGVIIADSRTVPLRRGSLGFALGYYGFEPIRFYRGRKDLFGRTMKMTQANLTDAFAASAVLEMGEGGEQTPLAVITGVSNVEFLNRPFKPGGKNQSFEVSAKDDIYGPLFQSSAWKK